MKGILTRNEEGVWMVKWSDLHSFGHGTHWMYTELSNDSNSIKYVKDDEVKYNVLKEGLEVEFEIITYGYDKENFTPFNSAKLIFPEVDVFEKKQIIKEYVLNKGYLFSIDTISTIRDGGTKILISRGSKHTPFYIHKDNHTLHSSYPPSDNNLILDKATQVYILDRIERYKNDCEFNLREVNGILEKIKLQSK